RPSRGRLRRVARDHPGALRSRRPHGGALRPAHGPGAPRGLRARHGGRVVLVSGDGRADTLSVRARVIAPSGGLDEPASLTVEDGVITAIDAVATVPEGLVLAPAFVDPHVHLRTPGREDEETIASGTQAAAAGGYCAILAIPNPEPVVDSAAVLGALVEQARADAEVQVGFLAAISKGQDGSELTEMG